MDTGQLIAEHYRLAEHIGSGAMGIVWKAIDERLERPVAVKQIITQPGLSEQEKVNVRQRAMREARNAARLQHPNAIVVFDVAEHAGEPCLVMEYMPAYSLSALLDEQGTLPVEEVARIGEQVAGALVAAHRASIVHRDVKPGNVLIDESGTAKLTDFGISRAAGDMTLTQTGLIGGTPAYLAPELARGADPTPSSDVFALGAMLYHAIEGKPVYGDSENQLALLYSAASGKIVPPSQAGRATALLMNLLRAEPEERISMAQARTQLGILAGNGGGSGGQTAVAAAPAGSPQPPGQGGKSPWQRTGRGQQAAGAAATAAPDKGTASFEPAEQADQAQRPGSQDSTGARPNSAGRSRKRKPIMIGGAIAVVVAVAIVLGIVLPSGGEGSDESSQAGGATTSSAPPNTTSANPSKHEGATAGDKVQWTPAGQLTNAFYADPGSAKTWEMLSPQVQQKYGSQQKFADAWSDYEMTDLGSSLAYKQKNNPDGTVDIKTKVTTEDGTSSPVVRVGRIDGELRIVSDPKDDL